MPLSEPWIQRDLPASETTELGRGGGGEKGGGVSRRGARLGGGERGGLGREKACVT
jgi:hypothetical protein